MRNNVKYYNLFNKWLWTGLRYGVATVASKELVNICRYFSVVLRIYFLKKPFSLLLNICLRESENHSQVLWFPIARAILELSHGNLVFSSGEFSQISIHDAPRLFFQVYWSVFHLIHFISLNVSLLATDCIDRKSFCLVPEGWTQAGMDKYKGNIYSTYLTFWSQLLFCQPMAGIYFDFWKTILIIL